MSEQPIAAKSSPTKSSAKSIAVAPAGTSEAVLPRPSQDSVISLLNESWGGDEKSKTAVINSINDLHHKLCLHYEKKLFDVENDFQRRMTLLQNKIEEMEEKHDRERMLHERRLRDLEEKFNRFVENLAQNLAQLGVGEEKIKEVIYPILIFV